MALASGSVHLNSQDHEVKTWDVASGKLLLTLPQQREVNAVAFSPDSKSLAVAMGPFSRGSGEVKVCDSLTGQELFAARAGASRSLAFSPDGQRLAAGCGGTLRIWNLANRKEERAIPTTHVIYDVAFSPNGRAVIAAAKTIDAWDPTTGKSLYRLLPPEPSPQVMRITFRPDGKQLVSVTGDLNNPHLSGAITVWDVPPGKGKRALVRHTGSVFALALYQDGSRLVTAGHDRAV